MAGANNEGLELMKAPTFDVGDGTRIRLTARNSVYTDEIAKSICLRIMKMQTLREITDDPRMPGMTTVVRWLADTRLARFREMYYQARRVQAELRVDEIFTIADDASQDYKEVTCADGSTKIVPNNEHIQRSRVRIDTRKWFASKLIPRVYGENTHVDVGVTGDLAEIMKAAANRDNGLPSAIGQPALAVEQSVLDTD